ncbi:POP1 ribonuclease P/MRP subunit [Dermatophagoides farinae]|uniref:POP1 ribonuclease P/MRP subunit n=1 Tax=Dermatophagoides farinae TaxID=6954 RepID=UPI003F6086DF
MDIDIPDEISIYNFIHSHIVEINALKKQCQTKQCKNVLQRVPRHIRRRAASNNPKRLPKNLQKFIPQIKSTNKTLLNKRSSKRRQCKRKIRKRNKDSRRTILHMWFTKRFKMELLWNIFIPWKNNMKNQRILYRGTKNGSLCYYLPFLKTFLLQSLDSNIESIYGQLSNFIPALQLEQLKTVPVHHSIKINLYEYEKYPYNLIGPCDVVKIERNDNLSLSFTAHQLFFEAILEQFLEHNITLSFEPIDCSCVRLYGPHSFARLSKKIGKKIPTLEHEKWHGLDLDQSTNLNFSMFFNNLEKEIIAFKQYRLDNQIETIEILIPNQNLKKIWNKINANMAHLVGGLRDLEVMTVDTNTLLYPQIGYRDCMFNRSKNPNTSCAIGFNFENKYIIRSHEILSSLDTYHSVDKIVCNIIDPENALIQVMVDYLRGTPNTDDIIIVPKSLDHLSISTDDGDCLKTENIINTVNDDDHEPIGLIEYGCFSMRMAHSRAIGIISLQGLEKLFMVNQNRTQMYTLVKTKFNHFRMVTISLIIC